MKLDKAFFKKQWSNIVFVIFIVLLIVPQTGTPIKVAVQKLFAFSPDALNEADQIPMDTYNWPLQDLQGQALNLQRSEGKIALVNFWATWCAPCIAEMPAMQELYNNYGNKIDFYFVSSESPEKLQLFMEKKGYDLPIYVQQYKAPKAIETNSLPTTYLIDREGKIFLKETGAKDWDSSDFYTYLDELIR